MQAEKAAQQSQEDAKEPVKLDEEDEAAAFAAQMRERARSKGKAHREAAEAEGAPDDSEAEDAAAARAVGPKRDKVRAVWHSCQNNALELDWHDDRHCTARGRTMRWLACMWHLAPPCWRCMKT